MDEPTITDLAEAIAQERPRPDRAVHVVAARPGLRVLVINWPDHATQDPRERWQVAIDTGEGWGVPFAIESVEES